MHQKQGFGFPGQEDCSVCHIMRELSVICQPVIEKETAKHLGLPVNGNAVGYGWGHMSCYCQPVRLLNIVISLTEMSTRVKSVTLNFYFQNARCSKLRVIAVVKRMASYYMYINSGSVYEYSYNSL